MADIAAKQGANENSNNMIVPLPTAHRNHLINTFFTAKWEDSWNKAKTCKLTKLFLPQLQTEAQINKTICLDKLDLMKFMKIISGTAVHQCIDRGLPGGI